MKVENEYRSQLENLDKMKVSLKTKLEKYKEKVREQKVSVFSIIVDIFIFIIHSNVKKTIKDTFKCNFGI